MTPPIHPRESLPAWTINEEGAPSEREAFRWLQETGALSGARHVWTNAYFTTENGSSCERILLCSETTSSLWLRLSPIEV